MAIVAVAILISFHLKHAPTPIEKRVALPFGVVFWLLAIACLVSGLSNYIRTVSGYSRRQALVQTGTGTQIVGLRCDPLLSQYTDTRQVFTVVATAIVAACVLFLSTNASTR
jgi:hypothetical protein